MLFYIIQSLEYRGPIKECIFEFLAFAAIGHVSGWVGRHEEKALKLKVHKRIATINVLLILLDIWEKPLL